MSSVPSRRSLLARAAAVLIGTATSLAAASAVAIAAPVLEAAVTDCYVRDGRSFADLGATVTGAPPNGVMWIDSKPTDPRTPLGVYDAQYVSADETGRATYTTTWPTHTTVISGPESFLLPTFPLRVRVRIGDVTTSVVIEHVCPQVRPTDAVERAVASGVLAPRDAQPLLVKLGAAAAQEQRGNVDAAIALQQAFRNQVEALVRAGRLAQTQAQPLIDAALAEIRRLGGTP